jgi:putative ABC transport system permease protein
VNRLKIPGGNIMHDIRLALRSLRRRPSFTVAALVALGLGIGANTAVFSVVNAVLLRPLPYADADRIVRVYSRWETADRASLSFGEYFDYVDGYGRVFDAFGVWALGAANLSGSGEPERLPVAFVSAGVLPTLGVEPVAGRAFSAEEDVPGGANVALVTAGFVERRLGGLPAPGREIVLNGQSTTIIGVLPANFRLPDGFSDPSPPEIVLPLRADRANTNRGSHFLGGVARLDEGTTLGTATRTLRDIAADFVARLPDDYPAQMGFTVDLVGVREDITGDARPPLLLLLGAVGLVLLATCSNVASLLLARMDGRSREFALRTALGAKRGDIARVVVVETGVLAAAAGALGIVMSVWSTTGLVALMPAGLASSMDVSMDARVLAFAGVATIVSLALAAAAPLLRLDRLGGDVQAALRDGGRGSSSGPGRQRLRRALVSAEVALAVVLLAGAALLLRSFTALLSVDPGYSVENVLTTRITLPAATWDTDERRRDFFARLEAQLATTPGVVAAGAVTNLPLMTSLGDLNFQFEGRPTVAGQMSPRLDWQVVTPGYFAAMGMRIVHGRGFTAADDERAPGAVVINEAAAARHFPGMDPVGQRMLLGGGAGPGWVTVVGVIGDVRHAALDRPPGGEMYLAHRQFRFWNGGNAPATMYVVVKTSVPPASTVPMVRAAVRSIDPELPLGALRTMEEVQAASLAQPRFVMVLIATFAAVALVLAGLGLYALIAWVVSERAHEIGVRMALGARSGQVIGMVLRQGMLMIGAGVAAGLVIAVPATRALGSLLYGVRPADPATLLAVVVVLILVGAAACVLPARRAAAVAPQRAMHMD